MQVIQPPSGFTNVSMSGINNSGQVAVLGFNVAASQAFIGSPSGSNTIPLPAGWTTAFGWAINYAGQLAGYGGGSPYQAFGGLGILGLGRWALRFRQEKI